eukprot:4206160-Pleurochrysis_carterae.AAC.2
MSEKHIVPRYHGLALCTAYEVPKAQYQRDMLTAKHGISILTLLNNRAAIQKGGGDARGLETSRGKPILLTHYGCTAAHPAAALTPVNCLDTFLLT